jgi:hypothetical protein
VQVDAALPDVWRRCGPGLGPIWAQWAGAAALLSALRFVGLLAAVPPVAMEVKGSARLDVKAGKVVELDPPTPRRSTRAARLRRCCSGGGVWCSAGGELCLPGSSSGEVWRCGSPPPLL